MLQRVSLLPKLSGPGAAARQAHVDGACVPARTPICVDNRRWRLPDRSRELRRADAQRAIDAQPAMVGWRARTAKNVPPSCAAGTS